MLSKAVRGKIMLGWVILPSLGNVTQPEVDVNAVIAVIHSLLVKSGNKKSRSGKISDIFQV